MSYASIFYIVNNRCIFTIHLPHRVVKIKIKNENHPKTELSGNENRFTENPIPWEAGGSRIMNNVSLGLPENAFLRVRVSERGPGSLMPLKKKKKNL